MLSTFLNFSSLKRSKKLDIAYVNLSSVTGTPYIKELQKENFLSIKEDTDNVQNKIFFLHPSVVPSWPIVDGEVDDNKIMKGQKMAFLSSKSNPGPHGQEACNLACNPKTILADQLHG